MDIQEYKECICTKCIHYCEDCCKKDITVETIESEVASDIKPTIKTKCRNYRKWSNYIDESFRRLDWRVGRDGER